MFLGVKSKLFYYIYIAHRKSSILLDTILLLLGFIGIYSVLSMFMYYSIVFGMLCLLSFLFTFYKFILPFMYCKLTYICFLLFVCSVVKEQNSYLYIHY